MFGKYTAAQDLKRNKKLIFTQKILFSRHKIEKSSHILLLGISCLFKNNFRKMRNTHQTDSFSSGFYNFFFSTSNDG